MPYIHIEVGRFHGDITDKKHRDSLIKPQGRKRDYGIPRMPSLDHGSHDSGMLVYLHSV